MFSENKYRFFLLVIDCYSKRLYTQKLKTKSGPEVAKALRAAFEELGVQIHVFETDRGTEFKSAEAKRLYKEKKIVYKYKYGLNKASWAERYILIVKRALYMTLRSELSKNWPHYLPIITKSLNDGPVASLGFLKPSDIKSEADSAKVDEALKSHHLTKRVLPTFQEQNENQQRYEANKKNILPNSYCYLNFDEKLFDKSFHVSVSQNIK